MKFKIFNDSKELIEFANKFIVDERLSSLEKDVKECLDKDCAFPALLYCFSTVDLLGALYTGFAENGSDTTNNFKAYALRFMINTNVRYNNEQVTLIQEIFRHKIVHLAQPKLVVYSKKRYIHWRYEYPEINNHLKIERHRRQQIKTILTPKALFYDHSFAISITKILHDIEDSVIRQTDGYMARLQNNYKNLQAKFDSAIQQIYDPKIIS
jgi:hypothetical protein